ncbi:hypothetical protein ACIGCK_04910 [Microbacterium sp. NPDC078428]|uniref:hypothetical protein n=1 Tax=Microbacterium sp. NPDC078428 TaxID=3364190 RepID=UPI0037C6D132
MTGVEDLYLGVIKDGITRHPRSLQKRIGPSEIGRPCDRWILHKLNGDGEPDRGPAWKPAIGTAVHDQLERWFDAANRGGGDVDHTEWITEWEVTVGTIGGQPIAGHSDLFHVPTGTVIDHKIVGPKQLAKYRLHGPSEQYRVQAHLYGKGFTDDGGWGPARAVAIAFLPRDGELSQAVFWSEPYDPHLAAAAMVRANRLHTMLTVVGIDAALAASALCDDQWCTWCRAEKRAVARAAGASLFADDLAASAAATVTPACTGCGGPLPRSAITEGLATHPTCEPSPQTPVAAVRPVPAAPVPAGVAPVINLFDKR